MSDIETEVPAGYPEPDTEPTDEEIAAAQASRKSLPEAWEDGIARPHDEEA